MFLDTLLMLTFVLQAICPVEKGCFTDPIIGIFFKPLFFVENNFFSFGSSTSEILFLFVSWFVIGAVIGLSVGPLFEKREVLEN